MAMVCHSITMGELGRVTQRERSHAHSCGHRFTIGPCPPPDHTHKLVFLSSWLEVYDTNCYYTTLTVSYTAILLPE